MKIRLFFALIIILSLLTLNTIAANFSVSGKNGVVVAGPTETSQAGLEIF